MGNKADVECCPAHFDPVLHDAVECVTRSGNPDECLAIPGAIARTAQEKVRKNDRSDARGLARELRAGNLTSVYIPDAHAVEVRMLVRTRRAHTHKPPQCKNQIKMALHNLNITLPSTFDSPYAWIRRSCACLPRHVLACRATKLLCWWLTGC
jgi:hypothetical protein